MSGKKKKAQRPAVHYGNSAFKKIHRTCSNKTNRHHEVFGLASNSWGNFFFFFELPQPFSVHYTIYNFSAHLVNSDPQQKEFSEKVVSNPFFLSGSIIKRKTNHSKPNRTESIKCRSDSEQQLD